MGPLHPAVAYALDFGSLDAARVGAARVGNAVGMLKVGLELFVSAGPAAARLGEEFGLPVFLDLKLHDIPETVARAVASASQLGVRVLTVHATGGVHMLERAVAQAEKDGAGLAIAAVTVLTSLDDADLARAGVPGGTAAQVTQLARLAADAGVGAFVCSPQDVRALREALGPSATLITPGVRPEASAGDDQKRVATPGRAVRDGASFVVVGRPIRDASDPRAAALAIAREVELARGAA